MSIHLWPTHPSPNIFLLTFSILETVRWIPITIFQYLTKCSSLCLNGTIHASYRFAHTLVSMYLARTDLRTVPLYTCPEYHNTARKGLSIHHPFEFNYILNLYFLSMCFVRYRSWILCTVCNAAPLSFFRLRKFLMRNFALPLRPRYISLQYHSSVAELIQKLLDHFGVIINNPFVTSAVIFLINNWNLGLMYLNNKHPTITMSMCMSPLLVLTWDLFVSYVHLP
jgi:hypothetical protein